MAQYVEIRMRNMGVRNTVAVVRESVRKVAACATHGRGGRDVQLGQVARQSGRIIPLG